jgi:hypothetical protein
MGYHFGFSIGNDDIDNIGSQPTGSFAKSQYNRENTYFTSVSRSCVETTALNKDGRLLFRCVVENAE